MAEESPIVNEGVSGLAQAMKDLPPEFKLCGTPGKSLSDVSDELLTYTFSVLKGKSLTPPEASTDQWLDLLSILESHWIIPLLYWTIGALPPECRPPESITDKMREAFLLSSVRCLRLERQLAKITEVFKGGGVPMMVLRGAALACSVYPDPAARPCCDLDILVPPEQVVRARGLLEDLGYRCLGKRFESASDFFREENFIHQENAMDNLPVDLHWGFWELHHFFGSGFDVGVGDVFRRSHKVHSAGLAFETLDPVEALIQGATHLTAIHKQDMRLIWICDTALLATRLRVPEDWEVLQERGVAWRARMPLEHSLRMAATWFGLQLPDGFSDFSGWPPPTREEVAVWSDTASHHWMTVMFKRSLSSPSRLFKLIRSLIRLLFPDPDIVRFCYPPSHGWLLPLSYMRRWQRWFSELVVKRISSNRHDTDGPMSGAIRHDT